MPIFTATPGLEVAQARPTIVADRIVAYLVRDDKTYSQDVFDWMVLEYGKHVMRQLMMPRYKRVGHDSNTMYTGACARKAWHQYNGTEGDGLGERQALKFLMGSGLEIDITGAARLAGVNLVDNNRDLFVTGHDGVKVSVHPDGRIIEPGKQYNCEVKSADTFSFDDWARNNGPSGMFGVAYLTQASVEVAAWREAGFDINETILIAISTGSRQASVAEYILPYDQSLVDAWHARRRLARGKDLPPVPFEAEAETDTVRGKLLDAKYLEHGEAEQLLDKNGKAYGWKVKTGRKILPTLCSYCAYKTAGEKPCWPGASLEVVSGKPTWVVQ